MARYKYGRSRMNRRRPRRNRWRYGVGILLLALIFYFALKGRGTDSENQSVVSDNPAASEGTPTSTVPNDVISATELATPETAQFTMPPVPQAAPSVSDLPAFDSPRTTTTAYNDQVAKMVQEAMALFNENPNRLVEVRSRLNNAFMENMSEAQRSLIRDAMTRLSDKWLFGSQIYHGDTLCEDYLVESGARLVRIGQKYKVPYEILQDINRINNPVSDLRAGEHIKVVNGPFHAKIYRSTYTLDIYLQKTLVKSYKVGLGKPGKETPTGVWRVKPGGRLIQPPWPDPVSGRYFTKDDPDYPLGSRWIALEGLMDAALGRDGFAIHGTKDPQTIGTQSSEGCIRLHNGNVVEVYNMLLDGVSKVLVYD